MDFLNAWNWRTRLDRVQRTGRAVAIAKSSGLPKLRFLDIGALFGLQQRWEVLRKLGLVEPILCEPDKQEAQRLRGAYPGASVLECALGAKHGTENLKMARDQGKSSLLYPDLEQVAKFENVSAWEIVREVQIEIQTLDEAIAGIAPPDFIKIDVQGYELEVLKGGTATLEQTLAIEIETAVVPLYVGQPTHSELTGWMIQKGFRPVAVKTTGTFGGEGVQAVEYDSFFVNVRLASQRRAALDIWLTINRIRPGGSWDLY